MRFFRMVKSDALAHKYERIGYKIIAFSYWENDISTMSIHLEK